MFWHTVINIYILILLIIISSGFIDLLLLWLCFIVIVVITVIFLSIINVICFILSHFISHCSYYYEFWLLVACDVCVSSGIIFSPFSCEWFTFRIGLLIHVKNHFFLPLSFISTLSSSQSFYFFQHYQSLGEKSANKSEWYGLLLPIDCFE